MSHDAPLPGYTIRRPRPLSSLLPAVGVGVAVGLAAFYVTRLLLEREPILSPAERERRARALERRTGRRVTTLGSEMVGGADDLEDDAEVENRLPEYLEKRVEQRLEKRVEERLQERLARQRLAEREELDEREAEERERELRARLDAWDRDEA